VLPVAARRSFAEPAAATRLSVLPARVTDVIERAADTARRAGLRAAFSAHAGVGSISGVVAAGPDTVAPIVATLRDWRAAARGAGGHAVLESAPLAVKEALDPWDEAGPAFRIMQRIKAQLDPNGILNPGRYVGGI
jgi:glycolate oxidase FAD binding subunit